MNALREEFPMESDAVQADLRDLRKSMDQKFDRQDARLASALEQLSARFKTQDERFERQDTKQIILLEKMDARFERQDERFARRDAEIYARLDRMDANINRIDAKFESRFEAISTRGLTVWVGAVTAAATIAAAILANHVR
jgi:G:T-mismatch repair DNA endonuclease (very short patch repair protein)